MAMSSDQTRQYGPIEHIRRDHVQRYLFAADRLRGQRVLDLACGCGYGSWLLHGVGNEVTGVDIEPEAIAYARKHYQGPTYHCEAAGATRWTFDALVTFETLEHLDDPQIVFREVEAPLVIASVPNEERYPFSDKFSGDAYPHKRHYTPEQFHSLLSDAGYTVESTWCQKDKHGNIHPGSDGLFMIYIARRLNGPRLSER